MIENKRFGVPGFVTLFDLSVLVEFFNCGQSIETCRRSDIGSDRLGVGVIDRMDTQQGTR